MSECIINTYLSRVCERGTKCCSVNHKREKMLTHSELKDHAIHDTDMDLDRLEEVLANNAKNYSKWVGYLSDYTLLLRKARFTYDKKYFKLYEHYLRDSETKRTKSEVSVLLCAHPDVQNLRDQVIMIEQNVELIEGTMKAINSMGFNAATIVKWKVFTEGIL